MTTIHVASAASSDSESERLFRILRDGREDERNQVDQRLDDPKHSIDRSDLRRRLLAHLSGASSAKPVGAADTSWLLYGLARVAGGDPEALVLLRKVLHEADAGTRWIRYWILAGLARNRDPEAAEIAREVLTTAHAPSHDEQIIMTANAILADSGEVAPLEELRQGLATRDPFQQWPVLRALRVVPIDDEELVGTMIAIVEKGDNSDVTYDSIRALHHLPVDSIHARAACRALERFVEDWRTFPARDSMRAQALMGLGRLRSSRSVTLLIEELQDTNPTIVREAAVSLEQILDAQRAAARVVEAAKGRSDTWQAYARALRWMNDQKGVTDELGELMGSDDLAQEEACRELLRSMGGGMAFQKLRAKANLLASHQQFVAESEKRMNNLFDTTIREAQKGFHWVTVMDRIVFYLGLSLIGVSAALALIQAGNFEKYVMGGGGVLAVLYSMFFSKPRQQVESAVENLMRFKIVFLGYLHQLRQADQAYQRHLLEDEPVSPTEVEKFGAMIADCMQRATQQIRLAGNSDEHGS